MTRRTKQIKVSEELYKYIYQIASKRYGKGKFMPYYLYRMAREVNNK